ncbi:MAG: VOC family protein [Gammaproteobacteria bacterium]
MLSSPALPLQIVQVAYVVDDLDTAIERWHRAFGLGPFIVRRHIVLTGTSYRGQPMPLDISAAHVQSGDLQIELVCQHNPEPSAFRDMFAPGEEGLHHVAMFPDDYAATVAHYEAMGFPVATELVTGEGRGAAYMDTRPLMGHMLEVYRVNESLHAFYRFIADAARNWDGRDLLIEVDNGRGARR